MRPIVRTAILALVALVACLPCLSGSPPGAFVGRGFAPVNGTRLFYEVAGQGEPLVMIHGGQLDSRMWDEQFEAYAKEFRVLRYDVRGFGGSSAPDAVYSNVEDLAALLDYLGIPKAHLLGLSLGGLIAIDFALVHSGRVMSLSLAGPGITGFEGDAADEQRLWEIITAVELWLKDPFMAPAMENPRLAPRLRRLAAENASAWLRNFLLLRSPRPPAVKRLKEIKVPTLLVLGGRDVPAIRATVGLLETEVNGARKVVIEGAGHMVNMEQPEAFDRAVLGFLRGLAGSPPAGAGH
jgi:pimeloyl-ACP methyl ester carboxylesterase